MFENNCARDGGGNDDDGDDDNADDVMDGRGDVIPAFLGLRGFVTCHSPSSAISHSRQACVTVCIRIRPYRVELVIYTCTVYSVGCNVMYKSDVAMSFGM